MRIGVSIAQDDFDHLSQPAVTSSRSWRCCGWVTPGGPTRRSTPLSVPRPCFLTKGGWDQIEGPCGACRGKKGWLHLSRYDEISASSQHEAHRFNFLRSAPQFRFDNKVPRQREAKSSGLSATDRSNALISVADGISGRKAEEKYL